ncbi:contractile injection system tape measure protein [Dyadobacter chenwenxiniae]|uniref:contractile injection system tape measure protein n=1 Tax=Dyadobacter chenwenxiniae TaxID=2906456 RepID=UPI0035B57291
MTVHLEKALDRLAPSDSMIRIARLEIDLEILEAEHFGEGFPERMEKLLADRLQEIIHSKSIDQSISNNSMVERDLLIDFLRTGTLPWWSQSCKNTEFNQILSTLSREKPDEIRGLFLTVIREKDSLLWLLYQLDIQLLIDVINALFKPNREWTEVEKQTGALLDHNQHLTESEKNRLRVWLLLAHLDEQENLNAASSLRAVEKQFLPSFQQIEWKQPAAFLSDKNAMAGPRRKHEDAFN